MWSSPVQPPRCCARQLISNELAYFLTNNLPHRTDKTNQHDFRLHTFWKQIYQVVWSKDNKEIYCRTLIPYSIHNQKICWQNTGDRTEENSRFYYALNYKMRFNQLRNQTCSADGLNRQEWTEIMCNRRELAFEDIISFR